MSLPRMRLSSPLRTAAIVVLVVLSILAGRLLAGTLWPHDDLLTSLNLPSDRRPVVLIAFQPADCPEVRARFEQWMLFERVRVVGVLVGATHLKGEAAQQFLKESGVLFPVVQPESRQLERLLLDLGYTSTPVAIAVDQGRRVVRLLQLNDLGNVEAMRDFMSSLNATRQGGL